MIVLHPLCCVSFLYNPHLFNFLGSQVFEIIPNEFKFINFLSVCVEGVVDFRSSLELFIPKVQSSINGNGILFKAVLLAATFAHSILTVSTV